VEVARYCFGVVAQLIGIAGILAGGPWAWVGVSELVAFAIADAFLGDDLRERASGLRDSVMDVPVVICAALGPLVVVAVAWKVGQGAVGPLATAGMIASGAWLALIPGVPALHELYHKRTPWKYAVGTYLQLGYMDCTRSVAHAMSHHIHVGTPKDADTPLRGESMYAFIVRTIPGNYRELYELEKTAMAKKGLLVWSPRGKFVKAIATYAAFLVVLFVVGGFGGMAAGFTSTLIARVWVEAFNYLQHVGLIRVPGEEVTGHHVWNHLGTITRAAALEITNHCTHHLDAYVPYYRMPPDVGGPRMPNAFLCFLAAAVPPLFNRLILWPRLEHWDRNIATPGERALAREANRKAGWPDWAADPHSASTAAAV
jgi:hypothetical protein